MGPPQIFSLARAWVALPAPSLTPALVPCRVMARWCRGHSPICQSSCFRHGLRPVHQLHRMSKGPQRELPHIHSSPLLGAAIPPHHLINTASSYTLVKKPLKSVASETGRAEALQEKQHPDAQTCLSFPKLQVQSGVAELK